MRILKTTVREVQRLFVGQCPVCNFIFLIREKAIEEALEVAVPPHDSAKGEATLTCKGEGRRVEAQERISPEDRARREKEFLSAEDQQRRDLIEILRLEEVIPAKPALLMQGENRVHTNIHVRVRGNGKSHHDWAAKFRKLGLNLTVELQRLVIKEIGLGFVVRPWETSCFPIGSDSGLKIVRLESESDEQDRRHSLDKSEEPDGSVKFIEREFAGRCPDCNHTFVLTEKTVKQIIEGRVPEHSRNGEEPAGALACPGQNKRIVLVENISWEEQWKRNAWFEKEKKELWEKITNLLQWGVVSWAKASLLLTTDEKVVDTGIGIPARGAPPEEHPVWNHDKLEILFFDNFGLHVLDVLENMVVEEIGLEFGVRAERLRKSAMRVEIFLRDWSKKPLRLKEQLEQGVTKEEASKKIATEFLRLSEVLPAKVQLLLEGKNEAKAFLKLDGEDGWVALCQERGLELWKVLQKLVVQEIGPGFEVKEKDGSAVIFRKED